MSESKSPFLDLPAELRLQIYAYALAPTGTLYLTRTNARLFATVPALPVSLLHTNHQIRAEAQPFLIGANEIAVAVDAHDTCWPVLAERRLPQRVLEAIEHAFVVLDCSQAFYVTYADVDFAAFEALTALRTLRLAVVYDEQQAPDPPRKLCQCFKEAGANVWDLMTQVLMRVPARTKILCEVMEGSAQMACLETVLENRRRLRGKNTSMVKALTAEELRAAIEVVPAELRGCKSGGNDDVFAEYHEMDRKTSMWRRAAAPRLKIAGVE